MRMIPTAALALLALAGPGARPAGLGALAQTTAAPAAAAPALSGLAAWDKLKGNTIEGKAGADTFSEFFDPTGGVRYVDKDGPSAGTWAVKGEKVCFDFPEDDDRSCASFEVNGAMGTSKDDDGTVVRFDIIPGNPKGL